MVKVDKAFSVYVLLLATEALLATAVLSKYPVQIFHLTISDRIPGLAILLVRDAIVWFFAYLGYTRLVTYAAELRPTVEGKAIDRVAAAAGLLALGVALPGMFWRGIELFALPGTEV